MLSKHHIKWYILWSVYIVLNMHSVDGDMMVCLISYYHVVTIMVTCIGWASISGSLLASSVIDGGPGLSVEYIHVSDWVVIV